MKTSSFVLLTGSLVANLALVAVIVSGLRREAAVTLAAAEAAAAPTTAASATHTTAPSSATAADPETWNGLQGGDVAASIERLRAAGFPPKIVQALAAELVRTQFAPRRVALNLKANEAPFWMTGSRDPKVDAALREINREQDEATRALLGADMFGQDEAYATRLRQQMPGLTPAKIEELQRIQRENQEKRADFYAKIAGIGTMNPEERAKLGDFDKALVAAIGQALSPAEFEEYQMRLSQTADRVRSQFQAFDATEQEYRALFKVHQSFDDLTGPMYAPPSQEEMRRRSEAQTQMNDQIKAVLGDARYAEYQRGTDYNYSRTRQLIARLELPPATADLVYDLQKDIQARMMMTTGPNRPLSLEARNAERAALAQEAETKLTAALGARGYEAYKLNGGTWVQSLQPPPPRPPLPGRN